MGISIKTNHGALLVSEALLNALAGNQIPVIIHSDQGSEYKSKLFRSIISNYKILQSMSKKVPNRFNDIAHSNLTSLNEEFYKNCLLEKGIKNKILKTGLL